MEGKCVVHVFCLKFSHFNSFIYQKQQTAIIGMQPKSKQTPIQRDFSCRKYLFLVNHPKLFVVFLQITIVV